MTKRFGNHQIINGKRPKLDEDEMWDDLDPEALDKCFELATQVCAEEVTPARPNDVSILPSYNAFKSPFAFTSSTQAPTSSASTSKIMTMQEQELEIRHLKGLNKEKEGEISILRSKIKETTSCVQVEQQKTTSEWREKLQKSQKEVKSVRSDLEFKNLEIINLKQQLTEIRRVNLDSSQFLDPLPQPQPLVVYRERSPKSQNLLMCKEPILEPIYPLKTISPESFTDKITERHMTNNIFYKISRNTIPYLQNQQTYNEKSFHHKCPCLGNKKITIEDVYPDIFKLVNSRLEEIDSPYCVEAINKVICVTLILLRDLNEYLVELGSHLWAEDIQQADANYLLNEQFSESKNVQLGNQASKIIEVISRLVTCNPYTAGFICQDRPLKILPENKEYIKLIPHRNGSVQNDYYLLRLVLSIVSNIGKYRLATQTNGFLLSVISLLGSISMLDDTNHTEYYTVRNELFCKLFKEIVFARPGHRAIEEVTVLLKNCSHYKAFLRYLFKKNSENGLLKAGPKGVLYYNEDVCSFCVLAILLQNYVVKIEKMPLEVCYNMLSFMYNTFKTVHWIHHESEENVCPCLSQLYKLEIEFVFRGVSDFLKYYGDVRKRGGVVSDQWLTFFQHEIIQKVLNQMNFNNFELTEKYAMVYSQFKEIEYALWNKGLSNMVQFNVSEELLQISEKSFGKDF